MEALVAEITRQIDRLGEPESDALAGVPVLFVNVSRCKERKQFIERQLAFFRTSTQRICAVDARICTHPDFLPEGTWLLDGVVVRVGKGVTTPSLACTLSHVRAIEEARRANMDWALVCEDDALFRLCAKWPKGQMARILKDADEASAGIVLLYWGPRRECENSKYRKEYKFLPVGPIPCWGTVAYLISKRGQEDVLRAVGRPLANSSTQTPIQLDVPRHSNGTFQNTAADVWLQAQTPTFLTSRPMLTYDNRHHASLIHGKTTTQSLKNERAILDLYVPL